MKRILIRAGKDPRKVVPAETTSDRNLIGRNSGNLLFSTSAFKLLSAPGVEVTTEGFGLKPAQADHINENYDMLVIPFANAYRLTFEKHLLDATELIERLKIPVVVISSGAQSTLDGSFEPLAPIADTVKRFAKAVLERSATIAVRGEYTAAYLRSLGFADTEVIGCPSMFLHGENLHVSKRFSAIGPTTTIAANSQLAGNGPKILSRNADVYQNLHYIAQDKRDLDLLLWGKPFKAKGAEDDYPHDESHALYQSGRMRMYIDPWPWMRFLQSCEFSFGTRIHGNIAALLAGTPAFVIAHDSRTLELAQYFEIPHVKAPVPDGLDAADLYESADYAPLNSGHQARWDRMQAFMRRNNLPNIFDTPGAAEDFDAQMAAITFPAPVLPPQELTATELVRRMHWIAKRADRQSEKLEKRIDALKAKR